MAAKIPNDIYQFSLLSALNSGLNLSGPPVRALQGYGSDGIAYLPRNSGELLFLDSTAYTIHPNASDATNENIIEHAKGDVQLPFVMVTKFVPEFSLNVVGDMEMESLMDLFGCEGPLAGGKNSFMPFRLRGVFSWVELGIVGPRYPSSRSSSASGSPLTPTGTPEKEVVHELLDVKGTIFGFVGPKWAERISVSGFHCCFLSERNEEGRLRGGRVKDFKASGAVELTWSLTGRFHLGLPSGEEWESLDLNETTEKMGRLHV
jgi:acetolactate decarboxylase